MRKFLSVTLTLILLFSMAVPAFATTNDTEATETRTVEEILNEYHEKSFAAEMAEETGNPTAYSNRDRSSGKTLEEETVDELRAAGYEAYHVTASNYEILEADLKTDFAAMGLDPNGSYIIAISGEEPGTQRNPNTRDSNVPEQDYDDDDGSSFLYYYEPYDRYYKMQYITYTGASLTNSGNSMLNETLGETFIRNLINFGFTAYLDSNSGGLYLGTIYSLLGFDITKSYTASSSVMSVIGIAAWTRTCIQIWDEQVGAWKNTVYFEYANTRTQCNCLFYNTETNLPDSYEWDRTKIIYSPLYYNSTQLKNNAVFNFGSGIAANDRTGDIRLYFEDRNGEINYGLTIYELF